MGSLTLDKIRNQAAGGVYPVGLLEQCDTALVLFAAGFYGRQDAIFIADAGLTATCVDNDYEKLRAMTSIYPDGWEFIAADVFAYTASTLRVWDLVSIDTPSDSFQRCADEIAWWCSFAEKAVVLGCGETTEIAPPTGWVVSEMQRRSDFKGGVYWAVIEPVAA